MFSDVFHVLATVELVQAVNSEQILIHLHVLMYFKAPDVTNDLVKQSEEQCLEIVVSFEKIHSRTGRQN